MKVISDSSVLIALSSISQLSVLQERFPQGVMIPEAVWREVVEAGGERPGAGEIRAAVWIQRRAVEDRDYVRLLAAEIDEGEAEVIGLARQEGADVVLLDEKESRRMGGRLGLRVLGTVGLLVWAKRKGLIASLDAQLKVLQEQGGFRLSRELCLEALAQVGEEPRGFSRT
jgi:predicted nucleic acid-binding protein